MKKLIIIPVLKEVENLKKLIPTIFALIQDVEILIVDDNSKDGTQELVDDFRQKFPALHYLLRVNNFGYGNSILAGYKWAIDHDMDLIVTMDADFSHDPKELPSIFEKLSKHDVVIGSRYVDGGKIENWSWYRRLLSWIAQLYVRTILDSKIYDNTTGYVGLNKSALSYLYNFGLNSKGYSFLVESKYRLRKAGYKITEHPIVYSERREGESKMSWKNISESILMPWRMR